MYTSKEPLALMLCFNIIVENMAQITIFVSLLLKTSLSEQ